VEEALAQETTSQLEPNGTELTFGEKPSLTDNTSLLTPAKRPKLRLILFPPAEKSSLLERLTEELTSPSETTTAKTGPTSLLPDKTTSRRPSDSLPLKESRTLTILFQEELDALGTSFPLALAADSNISTCGTEMITQEDNSGQLRKPVKASHLLLEEDKLAIELCFLLEPPGGDPTFGLRTTDLADRSGNWLNAPLTNLLLLTLLPASGGEIPSTTPGTGECNGNSPAGTGSPIKEPTGDSGGETTDS
jgi:hypothetical protein